MNTTRKEYLSNLVIMIAGNALIALSLVFILQSNIMVGGMAGVGIVLSDFDIRIVITVLTWFLFFIGLIFLGKKFALHTLVSTIVYPLLISLFVYLFIDLNIIENVAIDRASQLIYGLISGGLAGLGLGLVFRIGGSTGGFDILSYLLARKFKIKISSAVFILDAIVISCGLIVGHDLISISIGLISLLVTSFVINRVIIGFNATTIVEIISSKYLVINEFIQNEMERGSTLYLVQGGWQQEERIVLRVALDKRQYHELITFIQKIDRNAFVVCFLAREVFGNGFKNIKSK